MRLGSTKSQSLKGLFYGFFVICTGFLFISYHHASWPVSTPQFVDKASGKDIHVQESRLFHSEASDQVEQWRKILEGTDEEFSEVNVAGAAKNNTTLSSVLLRPTNILPIHPSTNSFDQAQNFSTIEKRKREANGTETSETSAKENVELGTKADCLGLCSLDVKTESVPEVVACRQDFSLLPTLVGIYAIPSLNLSPSFNASVTEYYTTVNHDVIVIQIRGIAAHCQAEVRLGDRFGPAGLANYTIGVGLNRVPLFVVDRLHSEPWVLNTYVVNIYRQPPGELFQEFDENLPHQVCYLRQDCDLPFLISEPCGLQPGEHHSWKSFQTFSQNLRLCRSGAASGRWVLPCSQCARKETCFWSKAVWQPFDCSHFYLSRHHLKRCVSGKTIMFIGDSTNRGMTHYLIEQTNDSLIESDKIHDTKVYDNVNGNRTTVSFAYFPQFWLPSAERPLFEDSLMHLMKISQAFTNDRNTVLVVGGVHWLSVQHLNRISVISKQMNLSNIRVIVKTLGAGFHVKVDGLHHLTLNEQRRLFVRNMALISEAQSLGFEVLETFNMTMARYKDFVQGKCACHFHRIKDILPSFSKYRQHLIHSGQAKLSDVPIQYHVEGDINAVYSEILLNRICDGG